MTFKICFEDLLETKPRFVPSWDLSQEHPLANGRGGWLHAGPLPSFSLMGTPSAGLAS